MQDIFREILCLGFSADEGKAQKAQEEHYDPGENVRRSQQPKSKRIENVVAVTFAVVVVVWLVGAVNPEAT